jgi:hypothetical protein
MNTNSFEELKKEVEEKYPTLSASRDGSGAFIRFSRSSGMYCALGVPAHPNIIDACEREHARNLVFNEWRIRYPNLYPYIRQGDTRPSSFWCVRDYEQEHTDYHVSTAKVTVSMEEIDGASIGLWDECKDHLDELNAEAGKSRQDGWFFCSHCKKAYLNSEYGYYWFATTLCFKCMKANPAWEKGARNESYN